VRGSLTSTLSPYTQPPRDIFDHEALLCRSRMLGRILCRNLLQYSMPFVLWSCDLMFPRFLPAHMAGCMLAQVFKYS